MKKEVKNSKKSSIKKNKLLSISIISLLVFIIILTDILTTKQIIKLDQIINLNIVKIQNPVLTKIMIFMTNLGGKILITIFTIILSLFLIYKKKISDLILLLSGVLIALFLELTIKNPIHRFRPENALLSLKDLSFPSGHAMISLVFFSILIYSLKDFIKNKKLKTLLKTIMIILIIIIGLSRIYLNVHWFSDVIAGYSLGLFIFTSLLLIIKSKLKRN